MQKARITVGKQYIAERVWDHHQGLLLLLSRFSVRLCATP